MGVLAATGFIVGESLFDVAFARVVVSSGTETPSAVVGDSFEKPGIVIGLLLSVGAIFGLYRSACRTCRTA